MKRISIFLYGYAFNDSCIFSSRKNNHPTTLCSDFSHQHGTEDTFCRIGFHKILSKKYKRRHGNIWVSHIQSHISSDIIFQPANMQFSFLALASLLSAAVFAQGYGGPANGGSTNQNGLGKGEKCSYTEECHFGLVCGHNPRGVGRFCRG
ncbi:hypothetical protein BASA62_003080 [Batrachochytrium salamandrivorans]|nr:hypothetical protein BASA62_003080 [Batrachochytrium salamandrivorans]